MDKAKKEIPITIWLTEDMNNDIENYCYKYDLTRSTFVRDAIRRALTRERWTNHKKNWYMN